MNSVVIEPLSIVRTGTCRDVMWTKLFRLLLDHTPLGTFCLQKNQKILEDDDKPGNLLTDCRPPLPPRFIASRKEGTMTGSIQIPFSPLNPRENKISSHLLCHRHDCSAPSGHRLAFSLRRHP